MPLTAEDVLFTYRLTVDPKTPTAFAGDFLKVKRAEVLDPHTFRVIYDKPFAPALMSWGASILPKHLLEGKDIKSTPLARKPVGTGPYLFKEWVTGQKLVLASNPDYFEGRPYLDGYIMRIIPDTATMFLELRPAGSTGWDSRPSSTPGRPRAPCSDGISISTAISPSRTPTWATTCSTRCFPTSGSARPSLMPWTRRRSSGGPPGPGAGGDGTVQAGHLGLQSRRPEVSL
jgi:hypothetical protein